MKHYSKLIIVLVLFFCFQKTFAQNIFNEKNSAQYADYLFKANQFKLSSAEYQRLVSIDTSNIEYKLLHIQSLRLDKNLEFAISSFNSYNKSPQFRSEKTEKELLRLYIDSRQFKECRSTINSSIFIPEEEKKLFSAISFMKENKFNEAREILGTIPSGGNEYFDNLIIINNNCLSLKTKSPFLSGLFSTILPGMGKVYSGYWQDGLLSFAMTGMTAYQTYRAFQKGGVKSYYGWISAGLTCGFYFGNIYGSVKSTHKHNHLLLEPNQTQIEEVYNHIN